MIYRSGYEILSYKKKYYYYYVVNRPFDTAEIIMLSDVVMASKLTPTQKNMVIDKLFGMLCSGIAAKISPYVISTNQYRHGTIILIGQSTERRLPKGREESCRRCCSVNISIFCATIAGNNHQ